jgi:hypothetical protein
LRIHNSTYYSGQFIIKDNFKTYILLFSFQKGDILTPEILGVFPFLYKDSLSQKQKLGSCITQAEIMHCRL